MDKKEWFYKNNPCEILSDVGEGKSAISVMYYGEAYGYTEDGVEVETLIDLVVDNSDLTDKVIDFNSEAKKVLNDAKSNSRELKAALNVLEQETNAKLREEKKILEKEIETQKKEIEKVAAVFEFYKLTTLDFEYIFHKKWSRYYVIKKEDLNKDSEFSLNLGYGTLGITIYSETHDMDRNSRYIRCFDSKKDLFLFLDSFVTAENARSLIQIGEEHKYQNPILTLAKKMKKENEKENVKKSIEAREEELKKLKESIK